VCKTAYMQVRDDLDQAAAQEAERQRKIKSFWSAFGALPDFAPGVTAETLREDRHRSGEHQNRKLAKHWGYDPARLHRPD
jgi:hypothetical protein